MARFRLGDPAQLRAWRCHWLIDPLFGLIDYALHYGLRIGPIASCSAVGCALGVLSGRYRFHAWDRRARDNLRRLRPELGDGPRLDAILTRMWCQIGRVMTEFSVLDRLWPANRVTVSGSAPISAARAAGRPVIVMGLHLADWEVIAPTLTRLLAPLYFVYQPPRNRFQHRIAVKVRRRCGAILLPPSLASTRQARRALVDERAALLMFVDELVKGRVNAPAFGRPLRARGNLATVVRLALASDALLVPAYVERQAGTRFHVRFEPPVELARDGGAETVLQENVRRLDALIAPIVLARLDQWLMLHDLRFDR
jgi:Kdo2-lipid IVA lauroyltransferase/acyltransferase